MSGSPRILARLATFALVVLLATAVGAQASTAKKKSPKPAQKAAAQARLSLWNRNLIPNGDAELEQDGFASGWQPEKLVQSERYGHTAGEWEDGADSGPGARERYVRLPVPDGQESIFAEQWISVAAESAAIDTAEVAYKLSGWMGTVNGDAGTAMLAVEFLSGDASPLGEAVTDPVPAAELPKPTVGIASLLQRTATGTLPAGTRRIHVTLIARNLKFTDCPNCSALALADQLSLVLTKPKPTPKPAQP